MKKFFMNVDMYIAVVGLLFMTMLAFANVVSRYALHASISATDELTTNMFVLVSLLGASVATKKRSHLGLSVFTDLMPKSVTKVLEVFSCAISSVFCGAGTWLGLRMAMQQFGRGQVSPALRVPEWIYGSFFVIGMALVTISFIVTAYSIIVDAPEDDDKIGEVM